MQTPPLVFRFTNSNLSNPFTANSNFSNVWEVGKCLWRKQILDAYSILKSTNWMLTGNTMEGDLIEKWKQQMVLEQRRALASSYSVLKLDFLTEQLFCESQEKALESMYNNDSA